MWLAASLALVESGQWRRTSAFLSQIRVDLQIRIDDLKFSEAEVWMLAMAKGAAAPLSCVIRGLPRWVVEEHTQVGEVVRIQNLPVEAFQLQLNNPVRGPGGPLPPGGPRPVLPIEKE